MATFITDDDLSTEYRRLFDLLLDGNPDPEQIRSDYRAFRDAVEAYTGNTPKDAETHRHALDMLRTQMRQGGYLSDEDL